jgi:hypothetical protein
LESDSKFELLRDAIVEKVEVVYLDCYAYCCLFLPSY